ncbi:MAG: hypothetical protein A2504_01830 [Bdellovibrionales bacterium RIFOXYD12_FULL_39_22]|nr:MAG: hypothetical protein A2385_04355 [Bdellovibrionales bacterium RIFOXYB1_FULL_39_21]OFZ42354.1 MAG: hypothetical protein A2485_15140 [Bdellovibrionales bacterium RIFOXYC12_FULL_39_17]OFZ46345.1 MAG: hypothetical protein A2404_13875 [Bdellovibrionales bacterium RIFOXYC1_FULL_39_130]OFZ72810.1 MAG: hypothetical protein A2451_13060 [Bdellovibrionales bacterium RIFOXYC2_FULL_39_8]OFZ75238.1 MAG: hypothetical protein A2560_15930 [Bdellovibrionales bacterium RIFOXYD1_FULL_39_84]OFZ93232.1 MAG:
MEKNWLIRTRENQITGPLQKNEVIKLVTDGFLAEDDEVCAGNGLWIFIREKELLDLYLFGEMEPPFNPVSEAPSVVTPEQYTPLVVKKKKKIKKPKDEDLLSPLQKEANGPSENSKLIINLPSAEILKMRKEADEIFAYILDENLRETYIETYIRNRTKSS